jgi:hypothetical protein
MILQPFTTRGNQSYLYFWVVTDNPLYLGYKTLTIAPEPSVDPVAGAVHSMVASMGVTWNPVVV